MCQSAIQWIVFCGMFHIFVQINRDLPASHPRLCCQFIPGLTEHSHPRLDRGSKQYNSEEGYGEERIYILHDKSE